jgi:predicted amidophosphoribosyltransferase
VTIFVRGLFPKSFFSERIETEMTIELRGNWRKGRAFDVHTLASEYLGSDESGYRHWDSTRSEMGELVYKLKYKNDISTLPLIVTLLDKIKGIEQFDLIVPIPPTDTSRPFQPVAEIAIALGERRGVRVLADFLEKTPGTSALKNVIDPGERIRILRASMRIRASYSIVGKSVLLVDDLYRGGATLQVATELLLHQAKASDVCVLTMTKTRTNR